MAVRLADALWMRVDADNEYEKKDNRQKKLDTLHEVKVLSAVPTNVPGGVVQANRDCARQRLRSQGWPELPVVHLALTYFGLGSLGC